MYAERNRVGADDDGPIPCTRLADCARNEEPEWVWHLLTAAQWNHSSARFHWRRVLAMTDLTPNVKAVGQQLVEHCTDDNPSCFPGQDRLAQLTSYSPRWVRSALLELEARGFVEVLRHRQGGRGNEYVLAWPERYEWASPERAERRREKARTAALARWARVRDASTPTGTTSTAHRNSEHTPQELRASTHHAHSSSEALREAPTRSSHPEGLETNVSSRDAHRRWREPDD